MKIKKNRPALIRLMEAHGLTVQGVAQALGRGTSAVYQWRSTSGEDMPDHLLELLELKIQVGQIGSGANGCASAAG